MPLRHHLLAHRVPVILQERTQGRVTPESFTHGSAEQRTSWFVRGIEGSGPNSCDTFKGRV